MTSQCDLENDMRNLTNFHQSTGKCQNWDFNLTLLSQNRNYMSLKLTEELRVMKMKNDTQIGVELTCQFKIDMRNMMNFDLST